MIDIVLEILRAVVMALIMGFLFWAGSRFELYRQKGWSQILIGFGLVFFGTVLDITDNFEALNPLVVVGDTEVEAFLEKVVGYLFGFVVLFIGFWSWIPLAGAYLEAQTKLESYNAELTELEATIASQTKELEASNAAKSQAVKEGLMSELEYDAQLVKLRNAQKELNQRRQEIAAKAQELALNRYNTMLANQTRTVVLDRLGLEVRPRLDDILNATTALSRGNASEPQSQGDVQKIRESGEAILVVLKELSDLAGSTNEELDQSLTAGRRVA
ncbi:MAG: hypothetical protein QNJ30_08405 [Kiloniellales bacterium]|nr:hypothetical protein [Kiloniellales bacterium]